MARCMSLVGGRRLIATLGFTATALAAAAAFAGSCPPDQMLSEPMQLEAKPSVGVAREVLSAVDLTGWRGMGNFMLRTRRLTIEPHGLVPTHMHGDRPSIVYVLEGELIEHSALCAVPIVHRAGEWTPEFGDGHTHWWENATDAPAVVLSSDVVPFEMMSEPDM